MCVILDNGHYIGLRQLPVTNFLTKAVPREGDRNRVTRLWEMKKNDTTISFFVGLDQPMDVGVATYKLFDALVAEYTAQQTAKFGLSLKEYAQLLSAKDIKTVRMDVQKGLVLLDSLRLSCTAGKNDPLRYDGIRLFEKATIRNSIICIEFTSAFSGLLWKGSIMQCPKLLWKIHAGRNPHSYYLLRRLAEHKRINGSASVANRISIRSLQVAAPNLPSYESIASGTRHVHKQIIHPFQRDMDALSEILSWSYCHRRGGKLTKEETAQLDYSTFSRLLVQVEWNDYPTS